MGSTPPGFGVHPLFFPPTLTRPGIPRRTAPSSDNSFPILAIAIIGITATAFFLLCYYIFVIKCSLNSNRLNVFRRFSRSLRRQDQFILYSPALPNRGLEESAIRDIPIVQFKGGRVAGREGEEKCNNNECAVCLNEFHEDERIRLLPNCTHAFHIDCIDIWLQTNANCPLCRSSISSSVPRFSTEHAISVGPHRDLDQVTGNGVDGGGDIVIELSGSGIEESPRRPHVEIPVQPTATVRLSPSPRKLEQRTLSKKQKKFNHVSSMGDECIDVRGKDDQFSVQPIRRSFSMDSSADRQLYLSVQEILQRNPQLQEGGAGGGEGSSSSSNNSRMRRSFFLFGHGRGSSRSAVLPSHLES